VRLQSLHLTAFGPFTDRELLFRDDASLHVVFGPNESGKSSSLRALKTLFYGFAVRTKENFLHPSPQLQIGGRFLSHSGESLELVRWKRNKEALTNMAGEPIPEAQMVSLLGGLKADMFDRLYGLSHANLVSGGQALLQAGGKVGESLFAASLGPEYHNLVTQLREEHESLWSPRPSKRPLNECIRRWEEADAQVEDLALSGRVWSQVKGELEKARRVGSELKERSSLLEAQRQKKERYLQAFQDVLRRTELLDELTEFADVPDLGTDFSARRVELQTVLAVSQKRLEVVEAGLTEARKALSALPEESPVLEFSERVEAFYQRVGVITEHRLELPQVEKELAAIQAQIEVLLESLPLKPHGEQRPKLPASSWRGQVRTKAQEFSRLQTALQERARQVETLEGKLLETHDIKEDERIGHLPALQQALQLARGQVELDARIGALLSDIRTAESSLALELERLSCWSGSMKELANARVPSSKTVDAFERELAAAILAQEQSSGNVRQKEQRLREIQRKLQSYTSGGDLTAQDLRKARRRRDELWSDVYHSWHQGDSPQDVTPLVEQYQKAGSEADQMADELMTAGERLAHYEQLKAELAQTTEDIEVAQRDQQHQDHALSDCQERWRALWEGSGVLLESPRQMVSWLAQREELIKASRRIEHRTKELETARESLAHEIDELNRSTSLLALQPFSPARGLGAAVKVLEHHVDLIKRQALEQQASDERRRDIHRQIVDLGQKEIELQKALAEWELDWKQSMQACSFEPAPRPEDLEGLLTEFDRLAELLNQESQLSQRRDRLLAELTAFEQEVQRLRPLLSQVASTEDSIRTVERAQKELREAQRTEHERDRLRTELQKREQELVQLNSEASQNESLLGLLLQEAGVNTAAELSAREHQAARKRDLEKVLKLTESNLRKLSGRDNLETFSLAVGEADFDRLPGEIRTLTEELDKLSEDREKQLNKVGQLEQKLASLDGISQAAKVGQEAAAAEAEGRELLERYVRLCLAERLLTEQIEEYRKENEGPILDRASQYFQKLTDGRYEGVKTGFDRRSAELVLLAVSESGREVSVDGLSDGTSDQLFLALRLATIAKSASTASALPVIADDVLVHFDDARAGSALRALCDFSELTQVVLFTHLERDFKLAESLKDPRVDLIRLEPLGL
jgi:uncharacterized protein YhaN